MTDMNWPIWAIEFTPSSSMADSYPTEIGVACWTDREAAITLWSTRIDPKGIDDWNAGASVADSGMRPSDLAEMLNDIFVNSVVHGRGGTTDVHLATRLNLAAKTWPTYSLKSWRDLAECHPDRASDAWNILAKPQGDAEERVGRLMQAIAHLCGVSPTTRHVATMAVSLPL